MASTITKKKPSAANLLRDSRDIYGSILSLFQQNHDLCTRSGFFPDYALMQIDSCAVDFRRLGLQIVDVAKLISNAWLNIAILLYKHISKFSPTEAMLEYQRLGVQAKKLSQIFKVIAVWARDIAERIHRACKDAKGEIDAFRVKFDEALEGSLSVLDQAQTNLKSAQDDLQDKVAESQRWKISVGPTAANHLIFFPVGALGSLTTDSGYGVMRKAVHDAEDAKFEAEKNHTDAHQKLDSAKTNDNKAKMIAEVAADLLKSLRGMEIISEAIGHFWMGEFAFFDDQVSDTLRNQAHYVMAVLVHVVSNEHITAWTAAKKMFDDYAAVIINILNIYNFPTDAQPIESKVYNIAELSFDFSVPSNLHVESIMNEDQETDK